MKERILAKVIVNRKKIIKNWIGNLFCNSPAKLDLISPKVIKTLNRPQIIEMNILKHFLYANNSKAANFGLNNLDLNLSIYEEITRNLGSQGLSLIRSY